MSSTEVTWWRQARRRATAAVALAAAGAVLSFAGQPAARWQAENQPAFQAASLEGALGQGALLGIFGGLRAIMADFAWVRGNVHWENRDRAACETFMRLAIALDPGNVFFWVNAGDALAFDMSHWEVAQREGSRRGVPAKFKLDKVVVESLNREYAERGIALLTQGAERNPQQAAELWIRCAQVCIIRLKDNKRAAEFWRRAAECENPTWFAGVAYANFLNKELGKKQEAIEWMRAYQKSLEPKVKDKPNFADIRDFIANELSRLEAE
ncbi:MAG: hypothetical protein LBV28_00445 [Puniceicoccales bacterium]|jgi:hypothetical protein|nr:hypothetical protein [Puniceicoccales bacterium]